MRRSEQRILTTHAGSLPRPPDLAKLLYDVLDGNEVDQEELHQHTRTAVAEVVRRQRELGVDVISDGEMGKVGFSNYVLQHLDGFEGAAAQAHFGDVAEVPEIAADLFQGEGVAHLRLPLLNGPIQPRDQAFVQREISVLDAALGDADHDGAFIPAVTPGQMSFNFPNHHYPTHRAYLEAAAEALAPEYRAIIEAGFNLQLDSPDSAMAFHTRAEGTDLGDPRAHLADAIEVLNDALADLPSDKLRYHVCWGNYRGPHHKDVPLREVAELVLRTRCGFVYVEAANPRHEHEWQVWQEVTLPEDKALIVGVIDTKTNHIEHPELVAQRIQRYAGVVGRERVIAATDCGFATFVGAHPCPPPIAWRKLQALVEGARIASQRLW
jgi:5-methyltetrahydropteroyltriglutamate--homocysteine methyltransferase